MRIHGWLRPLALVLLADSGIASAQCGLELDMIEQGSTRIDQQFDELFTSFGPGWTGGDSTYSIDLPDGRTLWLFSDTLLGHVNPSRTRPRNAPFINNSLVVQDGGNLETFTGMIGTLPVAYFRPVDDSSWYWVYDALLEETTDGTVLRVFLIRFERTEVGGTFSFRWLDNALATVSLPELELVSIQPAPSGHGVSWGAAVMESADWTYIYGTEDLGDDKYMRLARAPTNQVTDYGSWQFADGAGGWSAVEADSARLLHGVANEYSVTRIGEAYLLITMDTAESFSPSILAFSSCDPQGPWENRALLYETPETVEGLSFTYNAHAHPQFTKDSELLISYNVNARDVAWIYADADLYRPRFIRVRLSAGTH